ncbi:hypothetical protein F5Y17DRAFT_337401 [Xylariaceae sp. FL0594]|nr:hypothetical protein F5Y17DRAFT_337401 [Xylariaceae sp. FL0594]
MISETTKSRVQEVLAFTRRQLDRIVSPETRQRAIESTTTFASERPFLALFLAIQLLLSLTPLLLFLNFLLVATVLTLSFLSFVVGLALFFFLVPTLFLVCGAGVLVWVWAAGSYVAGRAVYERLHVVLSHDKPRPSTSSSAAGKTDGGGPNGTVMAATVKVEA